MFSSMFVKPQIRLKQWHNSEKSIEAFLQCNHVVYNLVVQAENDVSKLDPYDPCSIITTLLSMLLLESSGELSRT